MFSDSWYDTFTIKDVSTVHTSIYVLAAIVIVYSQCFCMELLRHFYCKQIYTLHWKPKSVILNSRVTALGLFDFIYSAHYCIWTLHFVGHEWVFHGHILRQCWSLWWQLPVLCNPAPYFSDCPVFCTLVSNVVTLLSDCKSMLYIVNCS